MKRVVFYLDNSGVEQVDFSQPQLGNPGVGGTQFLFMTQPHYLQAYAKKHGHEYEFILLTREISKLPAGTIAYSVESDREAVEKANELKADIFVFRPMEDDISTERIQLYEESGLKLLGWAHNSYSKRLLDALSNVDSYRAHVCVCHEQLDALLNKLIYDKSCYIFNGFESEFAKPLGGEGRVDSMEVVYIGSLIPAKGFHMLAEAWPLVLAQVPGAKLKVVGSGRVYDRNAVLGCHGIAQEDYEQHFMKFLTDSDGDVLPSVEFLGLMGVEKFEVMKRATVGVVNPTGMTENCPGSALEFQACGVPVVSAALGGLWDTVDDGRTGVLVRDVKCLSDSIVRLLDSPQLNQAYSCSAVEFVAKKFNYGLVCAEWLELFRVIHEGHRVSSIRVSPKWKFWRERRWMRIILRFLIKLKACKA